MSKIKLRPLDDRVVVEPLEAEEVTAGGIVLPDAAQEKPQRGKVIATGPGKLLDSGNRGELSVKIGDEVKQYVTAASLAATMERRPATLSGGERQPERRWRARAAWRRSRRLKRRTQNGPIANMKSLSAIARAS